MPDAEFYLRWDGVCLDTTKDGRSAPVDWWPNAKPAGVGLQKRPPSTAGRVGSTTTGARRGQGTALHAQRAEIVLLSVDQYFAPAAEYADIKVRVKNIEEAGCIVLQIWDKNNRLVYAERLTQNAIWTVAAYWTRPATDVPPLAYGPAEPEARRKKRAQVTWATPVLSPYTVRLWISNRVCFEPESGMEIGLTNAAETKQKKFWIAANGVETLSGARTRAEVETTSVRYHSLELESVPWADLYKGASGETGLGAPADPVKRRMWVQYKLNELGYWAGPVDGNDTDDLKKAIRRFKLAHHDLAGWQDPPYELAFVPVENEQKAEMQVGNRLRTDYCRLDDELVNVLGPASSASLFARQGLDPALPNAVTRLDPADHRRILIDNHRFFFAEQTEFGARDPIDMKWTCEQEWLTRPHIPIRAKIYIKSKTNQARFLPAAAVGAPLRWTWVDESETGLRAAGLAPDLPAYTAAAPSRTKDYVEGTKQMLKRGAFHGAPDSAGGFITGDDQQDICGAFERCAPLAGADYTAEPTGLFTRAYGADPSKDPFYGYSIVYLKASNIGGDSHKVQAKLDFSKEGAAAAVLNNWHPAAIQAETGWFVVWRRVRLAAYVAWPRRAADFDLTAGLTAAQAEFKLCFLEFETDKLRNATISDLFNSDDYDSVLQTSKDRRSLVDEYLPLKTHFTDQAVYPLDPEAHAAAPNLHDALHRLTRFDWITGEMAADRVVEQAALIMRLVCAWRDHAQDPDIQAAGAHYAAQFAQRLEDPAGTGAWQYRAAPAPGGPPAPPVVMVPLPPHAPVKQLTAAQLEDILLPRPLRDEITQYAAGASQNAAFSVALKRHWNNVFATMTEMEKEYHAIFDEKLTVVIAAGTTDFKPAITPGLRKEVLRIRELVLIRRIGGLLDQMKMPLAERTDLRVRQKLVFEKKLADGAVLLDYRVNTPVALPANNQYLVGGVAFGGLNGVALLDQGLPTKFYSLVAHELAHCMFLQHWLNAPASDSRFHDVNDDNCMMSYPLNDTQATFDREKWKIEAMGTKSPETHYCWQDFTPHFCGKCNLALRGWKVSRPAPVDSRVPVVPPRHVPEVRFIPGTVDDTARSSDAAALATAGISYYPTHLMGAKSAPMSGFKFSDLQPFPTGFGYDATAALDPNAFRVEVVDEDAPGPVVRVTLEALKPVYGAGHAVTGHVEFDNEERFKRSLVNVECQQIAADPACYRSRYIRLVTSEVDYTQLHATKQALLVTDIADGLGGENDLVEILEQLVRVTYDPTPV